jgi:transcriptional regulator with XRE-family HTH domain
MSWKHDLGGQLRTARLAMHITQDQLARHLNVSRQMIIRYEAGSAAPGYDKLSLAASILAVEFEVLDLKITTRNENKSTPPILQSMPKQLSFDYNRSRSFQNVVVKITPHKGRLLITADIPA